MRTLSSRYDWGREVPRLEGRRIVLRPIGMDDAPALLAVLGDPEVIRYWGSPPLRDLDAARTLVQDIFDLFEERKLFEWGVALRDDERLIGTVTLYQFDHDHRRAEVGFSLARTHWGQGLARDAVGTILRFAFESLGLHRIEADVDPDNAASLRLLEGQGFRREGLLRERWHHLGEIRDGVFLGLLRHEWTGASNPKPG